MAVTVVSDVFREAIRDLGIDPNQTERVIIDLRANEPARVYVQQFGDERLLSIVGALGDAEIIYAPSRAEGEVSNG